MLEFSFFAALRYAIFKSSDALKAELDRKWAAETATVITPWNAWKLVLPTDQFDMDKIWDMKIWIPDPSKRFGYGDADGCVRCFLHKIHFMGCFCFDLFVRLQLEHSCMTCGLAKASRCLFSGQPGERIITSLLMFKDVLLQRCFCEEGENQFRKVGVVGLREEVQFAQGASTGICVLHLCHGRACGFWVSLQVIIFRCLDILRRFEFRAGQVRMALQTVFLGGRAGVVHCILEAIIGDELNPASKDDTIYSSSGIFEDLAEV